MWRTVGRQEHLHRKDAPPPERPDNLGRKLARPLADVLRDAARWHVDRRAYAVLVHRLDCGVRIRPVRALLLGPDNHDGKLLHERHHFLGVEALPAEALRDVPNGARVLDNKVAPPVVAVHPRLDHKREPEPLARIPQRDLHAIGHQRLLCRNRDARLRKVRLLRKLVPDERQGSRRGVDPHALGLHAPLPVLNLDAAVGNVAQRVGVNVLDLD